MWKGSQSFGGGDIGDMRKKYLDLEVECRVEKLEVYYE